MLKIAVSTVLLVLLLCMVGGSIGEGNNEESSDIFYEIIFNCTVDEKWCFKIMADSATEMAPEQCTVKRRRGLRLHRTSNQDLLGQSEIHDSEVGVLHNCTSNGHYRFYALLLPLVQTVRRQEKMKVQIALKDVGILHGTQASKGDKNNGNADFDFHPKALRTGA